MGVIKSILPFIGTALGGPLGGAAATFIGSKLGLDNSTVDSVKQVLSGMTPEQLVAAKSADNEFALQMASLGYKNIQALEELEYKNSELQVEVIKSVNDTMKSESASEHWPTYSWRPFIGFTFGSYILSLWVLPLFKITPVIMDPTLVMAIGGILGVASWFRGKAQSDAATNTNAPNITQKG